MTITELEGRSDVAEDMTADDEAAPYRGEEARPPAGCWEETIEAVRRGLGDGTLLSEVYGLYLDAPYLVEEIPFLDEEQGEIAAEQFRRLLTVIADDTLLDPSPEREVQAQVEVRAAYRALTGLFRTSSLGVRAHWPEAFWGTLAARLVYVAFYAAYGEHDPAKGFPHGLMLNKHVRALTELGLPRIGQVQRYGQLDYIENPWVTHMKQRRRRITPDMLREFLAAYPPSGALDAVTLAGVREMARLRVQARNGTLPVPGAG